MMRTATTKFTTAQNSFRSSIAAGCTASPPGRTGICRSWSSLYVSSTTNMTCTAPRRTHDSKHGVVPVRDKLPSVSASVHRDDSQKPDIHACPWHGHRPGRGVSARFKRAQTSMDVYGRTISEAVQLSQLWPSWAYLYFSYDSTPACERTPFCFLLHHFVQYTESLFGPCHYC
jgi:hypothetical protein